MRRRHKILRGLGTFRWLSLEDPRCFIESAGETTDRQIHEIWFSPRESGGDRPTSRAPEACRAQWEKGHNFPAGVCQVGRIVEGVGIQIEVVAVEF